MITEQGFYDRNILEFGSYEEYLDQQVTPEDLFYLEDQDAARRIVELGYKGKDFLSRQEFDAARQLALAGPLKRKDSTELICSAGKTFEDGTLLNALAKREELVRTGKLATIIFIRDYVRGQEVSAYIDYGHRLRSENFEDYFNGTRRLLPKRSDLSYYNWKTHTLFYNNSSSFQVLADNELGLLLKHRRDRKTVNVDPKAPTPGDNSNRTVLACKDYIQPPVAAKRDHKVFFGKVADEDRGPNPMDPPRIHNDPYFWLRDDERKDPEVLAYLKEEKAYYEAHTADIKDLIETIYKEHISHIQETDMSAPYVYGPYLYYTREVAGKSYKIYCRVPAGKTPGKPEDEEVLMDVNTVAEGKAFCDVALIRPAPPRHDLVAYSVDFSGNEVYTIEMRENAAGVQDKVEGTNGDIIWASDASAFFYTTKDDALRDNKIWRHIIGQPQSSDVCLYEEKDEIFSAFMDKSGDGHTLLIGSVSTETTEVHLLDLRKGDSHTTLELVRKREKGVRYSVEMHGTDTLVILTNANNAVNHKILLVSRAEPGAWGGGEPNQEQVLVPHSTEAFYESHCVLNKFMVISGRYNGLTRVWTVSVDPASGQFHAGHPACALVEEPMNEPVFTVEPVFSQMKVYDADTYRICYSSMATPNTWFDVNPVSHEKVTVKVKEVGGGFDPADYKVEQRYATAPDRTKIPLSLVYRKDTDLSKPQPCMLYGYGSYGISMDPEFSIKYLPYTDRGMVYCVAHIRGGSELGREWYEVGGKYLTKRNTFSDFIAAAEYLVQEKLTTPQQLACEGRSAGGLLMGAVLNMRPDLFQVAIAGVPFVDVMTTMCDPSIPLTTGEWEEWGNPNEYKYYDYMLSYSPLDNVRAQGYPNIMIQAGLHDPRVAYWEPAKWVAKLRALKTDKNELLLNMDLESGHFSAKDRYKYWRESAIQQAFVCKHLKATLRAVCK